MAQAGYSSTPLPRKLGLKDGQVVALAGLPDGLGELASAGAFIHTDLVEDWSELGRGYDYIHLCTKSAATIRASTAPLADKIKADGMIWMSWPKKASKVATDVTGALARHEALKTKLVDVKICALDDTWSGMKLVIRLKNRPKSRTDSAKKGEQNG
jgi:hypothetical protein